MFAFSPQPRGVSAAAGKGDEEDTIAPAWEGREPGPGHQQPGAEPVYINVEGHFACLLLDDDTHAYPCKVGCLNLSNALLSVCHICLSRTPSLRRYLSSVMSPYHTPASRFFVWAGYATCMRLSCICSRPRSSSFPEVAQFFMRKVVFNPLRQVL